MKEKRKSCKRMKVYDEEEENEEEKREDSQESEDEDSPRLDTKASYRRIQKNHPETQIIGDKDVGVSTRRKLIFNEQDLLSVVEPKKFAKASKNDDWITTMNEELDQIEKNQTWELVPRPTNKNIVGTKWVFKTN